MGAFAPVITCTRPACSVLLGGPVCHACAVVRSPTWVPQNWAILCLAFEPSLYFMLEHLPCKCTALLNYFEPLSL
jgi:hypothetical protein